jgi:hypothetical protein
VRPKLSNYFKQKSSAKFYAPSPPPGVVVVVVVVLGDEGDGLGVGLDGVDGVDGVLGVDGVGLGDSGVVVGVPVPGVLGV